MLLGLRAWSWRTHDEPVPYGFLPIQRKDRTIKPRDQTPSYQQLIDDHEKIIDTAGHLLSCILDGGYDAGELSNTLDALAGQVRDHLIIEDAIITHDRDLLSGPWAATWQEGQNGVARLREDWLAFLSVWDRDAIAVNRPGFAEAADHLLGRLRERIQIETQAFYATALQTGAISLR